MQSFASCTLLLLVSTQCSRGFPMQIEELSVNDNRNAPECLETLISIGYWAVNNFLVISDDRNVAEDHLLQQYPEFGWTVYSKINVNLTGLANVILFTNNFQNLTGTLATVNIRRMDSRSRIVISMATNFASLEEIKKASEGIPAAMWLLDKIHVIFLVPCNDEILALTYFPFARNCHVGELEVLDVWRERSFSKGAELFPLKMLDIHGCVQNHTVAFHPSGLLALREELTETGETILGGVGGRLITIIAEKMNVKLHKIVQPSLSWSILGLQVAQGDSMFSVSSTFPLAGQTEFLDLGSGYMQESFGLGYNVSDFEVSWKNLVQPLSEEVWRYVGYIGLLFCGLIVLENRCHQGEITYKKLRIFDCFGIFLGTARILPSSYSGRYLFGMWMIYSYLVNATYNSGLISFLTTPFEQSVTETFEELLADGKDFGGSKWHRESYYDPSDPVMMKMYNNFKIWNESEATRLFTNRECATGILATYVDMYNSNQTGISNHRLRMLTDKTFTFQLPIAMRRGSPFTLGVHRYTLRAIQGGFNTYWLKYYTRKSRSARIHSDSPTVITIQHIRVILYLQIIGLILSCSVFLGELIFHRYFRNRRFPQSSHELEPTVS